VARKKSWCKLIIFRFVLPHDTIPSTVELHPEDLSMHFARHFNTISKEFLVSNAVSGHAIGRKRKVWRCFGG